MENKKKYLMVLGIFLSQLSFGARVLFVGDSQSLDGFVSALASRLRSDGHEVYAYSVCASSPWTWTKGYSTKCGYWEITPNHDTGGDVHHGSNPPLASMLAAIQPDTIIVQTGDNAISSPSSLKGAAINMKNIARAGGVKSCAWITPPHMTTYSENSQMSVVDVTQEAVADFCDVYASYDETKARGFSREHFDGKTSRTWLELAYPTIQKALARSGK